MYKFKADLSVLFNFCRKHRYVYVNMYNVWKQCGFARCTPAKYQHNTFLLPDTYESNVLIVFFVFTYSLVAIVHSPAFGSNGSGNLLYQVPFSNQFGHWS